MVRTQAAGCTVTAWAEPASPDTPMQDATHWSAHDHGAVLRVAAIDGCTPMRQTPTVAGVNGASYAATLTAAALAEPAAVPDVLAGVNAHLVALAPDLVAAARPSATVAAANIRASRDGRLHVDVWVGGDAQVWAEDAAGWRLVAGGSSCAPETGARWRPQREALQRAGVPFADIQQAEAEFYNDPDLFVHHTPVGRFPQLRLQHRTLRCNAVVCATDGALLHPDLPGWLAQVRDVEGRGVARLKPRDDLAVVHIQPQPKQQL
jgi:hypothetical protein